MKQQEMLGELRRREEHWRCQCGRHLRKIDKLYWLQEGETIYRQLVELEPREFRLKVQYARILVARAKNEKYERSLTAKREAIKLLTQAIALQPEYALAFYHLGYLEFESSDYFRAIDDLNKSLYFYEKDEYEERCKVLTFLAQAYHMVGDISKADECYMEAEDMCDQVADFKNQENTETLLQNAAQVLREVKVDKEFIVYTSRGPYTIHYEQLENQLYVEDKEDVLVIFENKFYCSRDTVNVRPDGVKLLSYLLKNRLLCQTPPLRTDLHDLYLENRNSDMSSIVRSAAFFIRTGLEKCFHSGREKIDTEFLVTRKPPYQYEWVWEGDFRLIERNQGQSV